MQLAQQIPTGMNEDFIFVDEYATTPVADAQNSTKRKDHFSRTKRRLPQVSINANSPSLDER